MEKFIFNHKNGLWYELQGDYYLPCLVPPEDITPALGVWGRKHLRYIREHKSDLYTSLLIRGSLNRYLTEIDTKADELFDLLVDQMAQAQGITESLKAQDQMAWVGAMNNIRNAAEETIHAVVIFT